MKNKIPKEIDELLGVTPKAIHSAFLMDFADSKNNFASLSYDPFQDVDTQRKLKECILAANNAYVQLINNGLYWVYCTFNTYENEYNSRKNDFLKTYFDADEIDFLVQDRNLIDLSLLECMEYLDTETGYPVSTNVPVVAAMLNEVNFKNIEFSRQKKLKFIDKKLSLLREHSKDSLEPVYMDWKGNKTELVELIEALILNGNIKCSAKGDKEKIFKQFSQIFNEDLKDFSQIISKFIHRNEDNQTKFLNKLRSTLDNSITQKFNKNRR